MPLEPSADCAPPSPAELRDAAEGLLATFSLRKLFYLDERGAPAEGQQTLRDRISHALLHELKSRREKEGSDIVVRAGENLATPEAWPAVRKLAPFTDPGSAGRPAFLAVHEAL
jgi:hypothetical protein